MVAFPASADLTGATLTEAQFKAGLNTLLSAIVGLLGSTGEPGATLAALGAALSGYAAKTAAYTIALSDRGRLLGCSGSWTLGLPAVATAGAGFMVAAQNTGTGTITVDPASAELIDGAATLALLPGTGALLICTGAAWVSLGVQPGAARLLAQSGSATLPGIAWALDQDTGLFRPAADQIGFAAGGVQRALLSAAALQLDVPLTGTAVTQNTTDATIGRLLKSGDFGLGTPILLGAGDNLDSLGGGLLYYNTTFGNTPGNNYPVSAAGALLNLKRSSSNWTQVYFPLPVAGAPPSAWLRSAGLSGWSAWSEILHSRRAVGVVSQSGGIPTGAIIERGSNANGDYIRHADGTQICWKRLTLTAQDINTAYGSLFRSGSLLAGNTAYPAAFTAAPTVTVTAQVADVSCFTVVGGTGDTANAPATAYAVINSAQTGRTIHVNVCAIGRWF